MSAAVIDSGVTLGSTKRRRNSMKLFVIMRLVFLLISFVLHFSCALDVAVDNDDVTTASIINTDDIEQQHHNQEEVGGLRWCNLGVSLTSCPLTTASMLDKYTTASAADDRNVDKTNHCLEDSTWLLHPSSGSVPKGSLCGIIGPSGAGKTTFLNALGGATIQSSHLSVTGSIYYYENDGGVEEEQHQPKKLKLSQQMGEIAYLSQHDNFFAMLTPRETLEFNAKLPHSNEGMEEITKVVEKRLSSLGLLLTPQWPILLETPF